MANYCYNDIVFYSSNKTILQELQQLFFKANEDKGRVLSILDYIDMPSECNTEILDMRNHFIHIDTEIKSDGECHYFYIQTESAWVPDLELFNYLLSSVYKDTIKMHYQAEEPGCGIYINTDLDGLFFQNRYVIDCQKGDDLDDTFYFDCYDDVRHYFETEFPKVKVSTLDSLEDLCAKAMAIYDDCSLYAHRYEAA